VQRLRVLIPVLVLLSVSACGGSGSTVLTTTSTTAASTTTIAASTTTAVATTTTAPVTSTTKAGDVRAQSLASGLRQANTPTVTTPTATEYDEYVPVTDDSGILAMNVPAAWSDIDGSAWVTNPFGLEVDGGIGVQVTAAPNIDDWNASWTTPGVVFGASAMLDGTVQDLLDAFTGLESECTYTARYDYDDGVYAGAMDWWDDCGGVGTAQAVIVARPSGGEFTVVVAITLATEADLAAADQIVSSFYVTNLTGDGGALDASLDANYGNAELTQGFEPDPQTLAMEAGGDIDVSAYLGGQCAGFVTAQPDLDFTYSGAAGTSLRFYFVADEEGADTVMVVNDPNGDWWCADDSYGTLNPSIDFLTAVDGVYDIWVGTYESGALIPGTLAVTELDANHP